MFLDIFRCFGGLSVHLFTLSVMTVDWSQWMRPHLTLIQPVPTPPTGRPPSRQMVCDPLQQQGCRTPGHRSAEGSCVWLSPGYSQGSLVCQSFPKESESTCGEWATAYDITLYYSTLCSILSCPVLSCAVYVSSSTLLWCAVLCYILLSLSFLLAKDCPILLVSFVF